MHEGLGRRCKTGIPQFTGRCAPLRSFIFSLSFLGIFPDPVFKSRPPACFARRKVTPFFGHLLAACMAVNAIEAAAAPAGTISLIDVAHMSLEELSSVEISSVSKKPEQLGDAAAAVFVITREDIRRSGASSIPEILRLAPNLQVARVDANQYAISARGFNSTTANKLLVLIDGRSVYTPLYSGVFWDVQGVLSEDIERIEVISGPGGTLWGANAVNGIINIITRKSSQTQGGLASVAGGGSGNLASVRYGSKLGETGSYRIYGKNLNRGNSAMENGTPVQDAMHQLQAGFRTDWSASGNALTLQGDTYKSAIDQASPGDKSMSGGNLLGRWSRMLENGESLQVQSYYDHTRRIYPGQFGEVLDTYDLSAQHGLRWGTRHDIVWGGGYRYSHDNVNNSAALAFLPADKTLTLANIFFQDEIAVAERLKLTVGTRVEHNNYTGWENQPNVRLAWKPSEQVLWWSAISRVARTPSRIDREFFVYVPPAPSSPSLPNGLAGGSDFQSEKLTAYEIGYRIEPSARTSFSLSTFYNVYDRLRSVESTGATTPAILGNTMEGTAYGIETWGSFAFTDWWQLKAGYTSLRKDLRLKPGSADIQGVQAAGNDPNYQFSLRSMMNLTRDISLDLTLRSMAALPAPDVPGYTVLDGHLGWKINENVDFSLSAFNLLDKRHAEFGSSPARSVMGRSIVAKLLWGF